MSVAFKTVDEFSQAQRLDNYLLKILKGVPKSHIYRVIRKGEVRVNKGRKKADYKLKAGDVVRIPPIRVSEPNQVIVSDNLKQLLQAAILFEDKGLLVLNKPSGLAVHSGSGVSIGVIEALRSIYKEPEGPGSRVICRISAQVINHVKALLDFSLFANYCIYIHCINKQFSTKRTSP